jgi:hypothetical protein
LADGRKRPGIMTIDYTCGPDGQDITPEPESSSLSGPCLSG